MVSGDPWCDGGVACLVLVLGALLVVGAGWVDGTAFGLALLLGSVIGLLLGLVGLKLWGDGGEAGGGARWSGALSPNSPQGWLSSHGSNRLAGRMSRSAEEMLRERYARSELSRERYLAILEDILKDRYVRGELELDEYEAHLDQLLQETRAR